MWPQAGKANRRPGAVRGRAAAVTLRLLGRVRRLFFTEGRRQGRPSPGLQPVPHSSSQAGWRGGKEALKSERKIEDEIAEIISAARERTEVEASMMATDIYLERRLVEIEASLLALSRYLDQALAEIEKLKAAEAAGQAADARLALHRRRHQDPKSVLPGGLRPATHNSPKENAAP
jgi:hypothetical protein